MAEAMVTENVVSAAIIAANMLFSDDDSDDELNIIVGLSKQRKVVPKIYNYSELTIPLFDNDVFKSHFRMHRSTFEWLNLRLCPQLIDDFGDVTVGRLRVEPVKQLYVAIWTLANPESYRSIAERFGLSKSTTHGCVMRVVQALLSLNATDKLITWPSLDRGAEIARDFEKSYGFPGVVGCVDGCHIPIKAPSQDPSAYVNRKGFHSVLLQGVCDNAMKFIDCYAGEVGSIHDACMLRRSELFHKLCYGTGFFPDNTHLLGDPAYPMMDHLLVAFKDNGRLGRREDIFNKTLSSARCTIERTFALLKGRFRRLKYLDMSRIDLIPQVIVACCVLHNVCQDLHDVIDVDDGTTELGDERQFSSEVSSTDRKAGVVKRDRIANLLFV